MNPPTGAGPNRGMNRENYQHTMQEWRQDALSHRNEYQPQIEKQINSQFQNYSPPFYASLVGFRREWNLLVTKSRVSGFAATLGRELSDTETKAIAEHTLNNIHNNAACKWFTVGLAAYMTYRGRRTFQFPFYKPKPGGRFNPNEATSIFSNKKIRGPYPRATWHVVRFTAYTAVTMLMVDPIFRAVNFMQTQNAMTRDSRLKQFTEDVKVRVERVMTDGPATMNRRPNHDQQGSNGDQDGSWSSTDSDTSRDSFTSDESPYKDTPYVWEKAKQEASSTPASHTSSGWGVPDDDDDDASPIASSTRAQPASSGGSTWDRIRKQSQAQQQPQQQFGGQASYSRPQQSSQSQSSWDRSATSSNDYTFSRSDEERSTAKEQAQLDFDRMLEQERRGSDQGRA